jgi:hypothetical protein
MHSRLHLGVIIVIDTRFRKVDHPRIRKAWQASVPGGDVQFSKSNSRETGGIAFFLDSKWAHRRINNWNDPSQLGIMMELTFSSTKGNIRVTGLYWPTPSSNPLDTSEQLTDRLQRWLLKQSGYTVTCEKWIEKTLAARGTKSTSIHVVTGDFNARIKDKRMKAILEWGLINAHERYRNINTHFSGTEGTGQIDYILANRLPTSTGYSENTCFRIHTDHRPIWAFYEVGDPPSVVSKRARKKQRHKNVKNPPPKFEENLLAHIEKARLQGAPVGTQLEQLNKVIADQFRKPFNPPLQYWSPMMRVDMLWLGMHEKMLRSKASPSDLYDEYMHQAEKIGPDGFAEWEERFVCTYPMRVPLSLANLNKVIEEMHSELHARKRKEKYEARQEHEANLQIPWRKISGVLTG